MKNGQHAWMHVQKILTHLCSSKRTNLICEMETIQCGGSKHMEKIDTVSENQKAAQSAIISDHSTHSSTNS